MNRFLAILLILALAFLAIPGEGNTEPPTLSWGPVTAYTDNTPIGTETVRYSAYWTTDEHLSVGNLRALATSILGTSVTFDPAAEGMVQNQRVYLATRAALATGQQSPMLETLTWVAINEGPIAPSNPTIRKQ